MIPNHQISIDAFHRGHRNKYHGRGSKPKKLKVECLLHGAFEISMHSHIGRGSKCPSCAAEYKRTVIAGRLSLKGAALTRRIEEKYQGNIKLITPATSIKNRLSSCRAHCKVHGEFLTNVRALLAAGSVSGCRKCGAEKISQKRSTSLEALIEKVRKRWPSHDKYEYISIRKVKGKTLIKFKCPEHGIMEQTAGNHVNTGQRCIACGRASAGEKLSLSDSTIKETIMERFPGQFVSGPIKVDREKRKVDITCVEHGEVTVSLQSVVIDKRTVYACPLCAHLSAGLKRQYSLKDIRGKSLENFPSHAQYTQLGVIRDEYGGRVLLKCESHGLFDIPLPSHMSLGTGCSQCSVRSGDSRAQRRLDSAIRALGLGTIYGSRKIIPPKEIDISIPEIGLAIEYNGRYWHSERTHTRRACIEHAVGKQSSAAKVGLFLAHFDDTVPERKIVDYVAMVAGRLPRVFARKTKVVEVSKQEASNFLNLYHLQGFVRGCIHYGLSYKGSLVAVSSFSKVSSERGNKDPHRWELRRMAFARCSVVGGASRMLAHFFKGNSEVRSLISYSDNRWFTGAVYEKLGFRKVKDCPPDYCYSKGKNVSHKANFKRSKLASREDIDFDPLLSERENCAANGWFRIWDCGKKKWEIKNFKRG